METNSGFKYSVPMLVRAMQALIYGDLFMRMLYRVRPYEITPGSANALHVKWREKCIADLTNGQKFGIGLFKRNIKQMVKEFDEACFEMEVGELRGPIKTQFGYHIIRLDGKNAAEPMKFAEVKDAIREHLLNEKRSQAYKSKVNQLKIMYPVSR